MPLLVIEQTRCFIWFLKFVPECFRFLTELFFFSNCNVGFLFSRLCKLWEPSEVRLMDSCVSTLQLVGYIMYDDLFSAISTTFCHPLRYQCTVTLGFISFKHTTDIQFTHVKGSKSKQFVWCGFKHPPISDVSWTRTMRLEYKVILYIDVHCCFLFFSPSSLYFNLFQLLWFLFHFCFLWFFTKPSFLQFSLTLSPPLALPLQLSAQRVCLPAQTTAPPSPRCVAEPAGTSNPPSPRVSQSLPSVHHATLCLLLPPPSICLMPPKAPTLLPCHQMPPQLHPPHRPVAAWGPKGPETLCHDPQQPPAHWPQVPSNQTIR